MNQATVEWQGTRLGFNASLPDGHTATFDEPEPTSANTGPKPTDLLLAALASCSGISAVSLFKKMRQPVTGLRIHASGNRAPDWPKAFTSIRLGFEVEVQGAANAELIRKAVDLAVRRYCPVSATIEMGEGAPTIEYEIDILDGGPSQVTR